MTCEIVQVISIKINVIYVNLLKKFKKQSKYDLFIKEAHKSGLDVFDKKTASCQELHLKKYTKNGWRKGQTPTNTILANVT